MAVLAVAPLQHPGRSHPVSVAAVLPGSLLGVLVAQNEMNGAIYLYGRRPVHRIALLKIDQTCEDILMMLSRRGVKLVR